MMKVKDSILLSVISGLLGVLAMDISNYFLFRYRKTEFLYGHLAGSLFMNKLRTKSSKGFYLGQVLHSLVGVALGIPTVYLLRKTGKDHYLLKGAEVGLAAWGILYNLGSRVHLFSDRPRLLKTHYAALWHNFLYGVVAATSAVHLGDQELFKVKEKELADA